jgi:hypothetical protein
MTKCERLQLHAQRNAVCVRPAKEIAVALGYFDARRERRRQHLPHIKRHTRLFPGSRHAVEGIGCRGKLTYSDLRTTDSLFQQR